jgi:hypothetical protein
VQIAQSLASNHIKLVPDIMAGGGGSDQGGLINVLLAKMLTGTNGINGGSGPSSASGSGGGTTDGK